MPIDKIMSWKYAAPMKTAIASSSPVTVTKTIGPAVYHVAVAAPSPDPKVVERRAQTIEERRAALQDRYLLHRKNHVKRLDGRDTRILEAPEFLKRRGVRRVR